MNPSQLRFGKTKAVGIICFGMILFSFLLHFSGLDAILLQRILWLVVLSIVFFCLCRRTDTVSFGILYSAFLVRIILASVNYSMNNILSNSLFRVGDDIVFANAAREFYFGNFSFNVNSRQFPVMISLLYRIFGPDELIMVYVLVLLSAVGCLAFRYMLDELDLPVMPKYISLAVVCFAPFNIVFSILLLREPIYFCFLSLSFLSFLKYCRNEKVKFLLLAMVICLPAVFMHWGYAGMLFVYVVYFFAEYKGIPERKTQLRIIKLVIMIILMSMIGIVMMNSGRLRYFREAGNFSDGLILTFQKYTGLGGESGYLQDMQVTSIWQVLVYTPIRILYFYLSPLPMDWRGWKDVCSFLFDAVWPLMACLSFFSVGWNRGKQLFPVRIAFWILALTGALYCWATVTAGAAIRHRNCLVPLCLFMVLFAMSLHSRKQEESDD